MVPMIAAEFDGDLADFLKDYKYQPELTRKLDGLAQTEFTQELINEIVLWKVNRYALLDRELLSHVAGIRSLRTGEHRQAQAVIAELLKVHGVDLPMASAFLRFRNPSAFQIIDRHAYRAIYGSNYPIHTTSSSAKKTALYFSYLDDLATLCAVKGLKFETIDRVLYQFDKTKNGPLKNTLEAIE